MSAMWTAGLTRGLGPQPKTSASTGVSATIRQMVGSSRSAQLRGNRRRDTGPEMRLRSLLHRAGLRFRVDRRIGAGRSAPRPDIVFGPAKVAIFVDGCFWHSCPIHGSTPSVNSEYWAPKLARNRARDAENTRALEAAGWAVLRIWEHEDPSEAAQRITGVVRSRMRAPSLRSIRGGTYDQQGGRDARP